LLTLPRRVGFRQSSNLSMHFIYSDLRTWFA